MDLELLLEAERRGILPPDKVELLTEARNRGLVPALDGGAQPSPRDAAATARATDRPEQRSIGQIARENLFGDNDPNSQNFGEAVGSALNKAGEAMTFGLVGDEANAAVAQAIPGGRNYNEQLEFDRQQERVLERDRPAMAIGAELGGALTGAMIPGGAAMTAMRGAGLPARIGASMAAGAAGGGTYGFMEGEGLDDRMSGAQTGAAFGAGAGAIAPVLGAGVQKVMNNRTARRAIRNATQGAPTSDELRTMGNAAYQAVDDAGVQIKPSSFNRARSEIIDSLRGTTGFDELPGPGSLTPNSARVMQIMDDAGGRMSQDPTAALPFRSLDQMRRQAGTAAGNIANKGDQRAGSTIIEGLDDFVNRLGPDDVVAGDAQALQSAIPKARETWARMSRSQLLDDAMEQEGNYVSGGASAIRNQFARILRNPKLNRGFSEAEQTAMRRVVQGTAPEQLLNLLGGGMGQLAQMGTGAAIGGLPGALGGAALAAVSRKGSEAITSRNAEIARALVASGQMRGGLPVASDGARNVIEALTRRTGGAVAQ